MGTQVKKYSKEASCHTNCKTPSSEAKEHIKIDRILNHFRKDALFLVHNCYCLEVALTFNCYSRFFIINYCSFTFIIINTFPLTCLLLDNITCMSNRISNLTCQKSNSLVNNTISKYLSKLIKGASFRALFLVCSGCCNKNTTDWVA